MITGKNSIIPSLMMTRRKLKSAGLAAASLSAFMLSWGLGPF